MVLGRPKTAIKFATNLGQCHKLDFAEVRVVQ